MNSFRLHLPKLCSTCLVSLQIQRENGQEAGGSGPSAQILRPPLGSADGTWDDSVGLSLPGDGGEEGRLIGQEGWMLNTRHG